MTSDPAPHSSFLNGYLLFQIAAASASASAGFHAQARAAGLKVPEWRVLACLHDRDGQMITRLAQLALMEQSRLTRVVERMDERGLVCRHGVEGDRRRVCVFLTDSGRALVTPLIDAALAHEAEVLARIGARDARALKRILTRLNVALESPGFAETDGAD